MENKLNQEVLHTFIKGWQKDFENHAEKPETFDDSLNLRLYSLNGVLAMSSLPGTREVYNNVDIVKYLGFYGFKDELVVFAKGNLTIENAPTEFIEHNQLMVDDFLIEMEPNEYTVTGLEMFDGHYNNVTTLIEVPVDVVTLL